MDEGIIKSFGITPTLPSGVCYAGKKIEGKVVLVVEEDVKIKGNSSLILVINRSP